MHRSGTRPLKKIHQAPINQCQPGCRNYCTNMRTRKTVSDLKYDQTAVLQNCRDIIRLYYCDTHSDISHAASILRYTLACFDIPHIPGLNFSWHLALLAWLSHCPHNKRRQGHVWLHMTVRREKGVTPSPHAKCQLCSEHTDLYSDLVVCNLYLT